MNDANSDVPHGRLYNDQPNDALRGLIRRSDIIVATFLPDQAPEPGEEEVLAVLFGHARWRLMHQKREPKGEYLEIPVDTSTDDLDVAMQLVAQMKGTVSFWALD